MDDRDLRQQLVSAGTEIVGSHGMLYQSEDTASYFEDWRRRYKGRALAVALPKSAEQVAALVKVCCGLGVSIVPQGGNTGMTGGAIPLANRPSMILNVSKLNRVREIDIQNNSVIAEAGCVLGSLREVVKKKQRQFPMLLGSVGSCQIGGLISTNAGGTGAVRYGNMRDLVFGLEVVLPDGRIWNGLKVLRKDNSGYDLKQLFIGAEGTLGIVTAAALKLFPLPTNSGTAMASFSRVSAALDLLTLLTERSGSKVEAFELMSRGQLENVLAHLNERSPLDISFPWYAIIELADSNLNWELSELLEQILGEALERNQIDDAIIASDLSKAERIWRLRHHVSEANMHKGFSVANDTSVPISKLETFIERVDARLKTEFPFANIYHCGHIGDGNIHVIIVFCNRFYDTAAKKEAAAARANFIVHETSVELGGSISAEHGIGMMHVKELEKFKPRLDIEMMASIKRSLDPRNIMNPGKILAC